VSARQPSKRQPDPATPPPAEQPRGSLLVSILVLVLLTLAAAGPSVALGWGILERIKKDDVDAAGWHPSIFAILAWTILLCVIAALVFALLRRVQWGLVLVGVLGMATFALALFAFGSAWAAERQNYWDAYHFAVLFWLAAGSALASSVALVAGGRLGSHAARVLQGPAAVCLLICALAWLWTWNPWLQSIEGWIARALFLATHN